MMRAMMMAVTMTLMMMPILVVIATLAVFTTLIGGGTGRVEVSPNLFHQPTGPLD